MTKARLSDDELWVLSYYRQSEINGALFFGRVARVLRSGRLQADVTQHFADEAAHASYWTRCIEELGHHPLKMPSAYQDHYLEAAGLPVSVMEIMAVTQVFEKRVISQYRRHLRARTPRPVRETLTRIMSDERWHIKYVREALEGMAERHGRKTVAAALARYAEADDAVYAHHLDEYRERIAFLDDLEAGGPATAPARG